MIKLDCFQTPMRTDDKYAEYFKDCDESGMRAI